MAAAVSAFSSDVAAFGEPEAAFRLLRAETCRQREHESVGMAQIVSEFQIGLLGTTP
jgi:hypothetical protein